MTTMQTCTCTCPCPMGYHTRTCASRAPLDPPHGGGYEAGSTRHHRGYTATERYLRIVRWARRRYAEPRPDGRIIKRDRLVITSGGVPSPYARIEDAAAYRYLGCERRYPGYGSVSQ